MNFQAPAWFILLPLLAIAEFQWPQLRLRSPLKCVSLLLVVLILSEPSISARSRHLHLWVLVDQSASARELLAPHLGELEGLLSRSKPPHDAVTYVDFADVASLRGETDAAHFLRGPEETRLALAVRYSMSRMDQQESNRMLLLSDGYSTEPLGGLLALLQSTQVALDYRLTGESPKADFRVEDLFVAPRVQLGEPFIVEARVAGTRDGVVTLRVFRDEEQLVETPLEVRNGRAVFRFSDNLRRDSGAFRYRALISAAEDAFVGNNRAEAWVDVIGEQPLLVISPYENDPLTLVLAQHGFKIKLASSARSLRASSLAGVRAVLINNVPAANISREFLAGLDFYVRAQGGGLAMFGGRQSFGAGGYFDSPLDPLLPVSMELREEHRKVAAAIAMVLDRSGSMSMSVGGGMGNLTKMDLANEGSARSVNLLGPRDRIAILAVDSSAHVVVPLTVLEGNQARIASSARSINSTGGGIFVYEGLKAGWEELQKAGEMQRHLILFSDAADSEEPGDYRRLLQEMTSKGATVSVIGLGTEADPDAQLLKEIALLGNGRILFVSNAVDLPAVFAQETVSVARSTFVDDPTGLIALPTWSEIAVRPIEWLSQVDGYNLSYLKAEASAAALSTDEYKAPLVAFWQRGIGRALAVSFPIAGEQARRVQTWRQYGDFVRTLAHWLRGPEVPPGLSVRNDIEGNTVTTHLFYGAEWEQRVTLHPPKLLFSSELPGTSGSVSWERVAPGHFRASMNLRQGELARGVVQIGEHAVPFGPLMLGKNSEWDFNRFRIQELKQLAAASGGEERADITTVWDAPRTVHDLPLRGYLLWLLLTILLMDFLLVRLNYQLQWPALGFPLRIRRHRQAPRSRKKEKVETPSREQELPIAPEQTPARTQQETLFKRAKRRGL